MLGLAVVGLGYWGPNLARNIRVSPRTRLVHLCDTVPERLERVGAEHPGVARSTDLEEVLADPKVQAVAIATPVGTHATLATRALEAGRHVLVEKPLTSDAAAAADLVALAAERERVLLVDHVFLYSPAVQELRRLVDSGELGRLQFLDSVRINLGLFQHDVNVVWDLAPHDVSIIDSLVRRLPEAVWAIGASHAGNELEDVAYLHLDYGDGLLASVHVNWLSPVKIRHFMVGGSRRSVLYNDLDRSEPVKVYDRGIDVDVDESVQGRAEVLISYRSGDVVSPRIAGPEPLRNLVEHLADCVEHGAEPISGADQGLRVVRILAAAQRSLAEDGARVTP